jgi:hypothetical protein
VPAAAAAIGNRFGFPVTDKAPVPMVLTYRCYGLACSGS